MGSGRASWGDAGRPEGAEPQRVGGQRDSAEPAVGSGKEAEVSVEKDRETLGVAGAVGGRETGAR